jgi:Ca-activated chloride channel family protein
MGWLQRVTGLRSANVRRGVAVGAMVLATGGLILARASTAAPTLRIGRETTIIDRAPMSGVNAVQFAGPGAHGQVALSHTKVLAGTSESVFAEVRLAADASERPGDRAPLALVVVLDTSGSMEGEKIDRARDSVLGLLRDMRDSDEIALVRYSSSAELVQPLARLGDVREGLSARIRRLDAGGGTNIPSGLEMGLRTLSEAETGRVRRVVLVSDGLDSSRTQSERLASDSAERGITVSSMGIGLDFDESYMSSIARDGHGNFAFVNDGAALATFLTRELHEASATTVENAAVRLALPRGMRFVRATGAAARVEGDSVVLRMGSLFAGDQRRSVVELATNLPANDVERLGSEATWTRVGGEYADVHVPDLSLAATADATEVRRGEDGSVLASATSVIASRRELEAAEAYAHGDQARAQALILQNLNSLSNAAAAAPPKAAATLRQQAKAYDVQRQSFSAAPSSDDGKRAAKSAAATESSNIDRVATY